MQPTNKAAIEVLMEIVREMFPSEEGVQIKYKRFVAAAHGRVVKKSDEKAKVGKPLVKKVQDDYWPLER